MQFRWVAAITLWTILSGPVFGPPNKSHSAGRQPTVAASAKTRSSLPLRQETAISKVASSIR
jgi:hypothetical protein